MKAIAIGLLTLLCCLFPLRASAAENDAPSTVYMTKDISPAGLMKIYQALERPASGKVAVKLTVGEPGGHHYLAPALIKELVTSVNGTFIDGNTAYGGRRGTVESHLKAAEDHGFLAVAPMDILDAGGEINLPITGGAKLKEVPVGANFRNYDFVMVLSHFKGHAMGGFGGALKNISIGIASPAGKCLVHTAGNSSTNPFDGPEKQEDFLEAMAEAAAAMINDKGADKWLYISVMNNLSVDCDCSSNPAKPEIHDIGILASLDPVALDKACVDLIYQADDQESASLRQRMESKNGIHTVVHAEKIGLGSQKYNLVSLD
ncbi:ferredoxin [Deltaproteobacteria bacterium Smac51]|nr:ferredoxin [Deltaproteobacteria bacterium Smac51]